MRRMLPAIATRSQVTNSKTANGLAWKSTLQPINAPSATLALTSGGKRLAHRFQGDIWNFEPINKPVSTGFTDGGRNTGKLPIAQSCLYYRLA